MQTTPVKAQIRILDRVLILQGDQHRFHSCCFQSLRMERDHLVNRLLEHEIVRQGHAKFETRVHAHLDEDGIAHGGDYGIGDGTHDGGGDGCDTTLRA